MSHLGPVRVESFFELDERHDAVPTVEFVGDGTATGAYNEVAFRYFLAVERRRAVRAKRPFLLLLLDLKARQASVAIEPIVADRLFANLAQYLRETDFVGWYRDGHVVGAVLTQHAAAPGSDAWTVVAARVTKALDQTLPADLAERVQVRLYQLPPGVK